MTAPAVRSALGSRPLLVALYVVAVAFVLPSLLEYMLVSFPYRVGSAQWRFGAVGLLFNSVLFSPIIGMLIAIFAASQLGHRKVARTVAVLLMIVAVVLVVALPFFVLDFLQLRAMVNPLQKRAFDLTSAKAALTGGIMFCAALAVGIAGWRSAPPAAQRAGARGARAGGTVVVGGAPAPATPAEARQS